MRYGNCLIAALFAKIKDPKNVKIIYMPKKLNFEGRHGCHFLWKNEKENKVYHYIHDDDGTFNLFYKGKTKCLDSKTFKLFMYKRISEYSQRVRKKYSKNFGVDFEDEMNWHFIELDGLPNNVDRPKGIVLDYVQVLYGKHPNWKTKMVPIDQVDKFPKGAVAWRYQTPFTELFDFLWNNY